METLSQNYVLLPLTFRLHMIVSSCICCINYYTVYFCISLCLRCSSVVRVFAHGVMGRRIDPSWGGPIELFLVPASAPRLV